MLEALAKECMQLSGLRLTTPVSNCLQVLVPSFVTLTDNDESTKIN